MILDTWAKKWNCPQDALDDLKEMIGVYRNDINMRIPADDNEATIQAAARIKAAESGRIMWRNNSGALYDKYGRLVRYGLANDSGEVNKKTKSSDLIGITPIRIGIDHIGQTLGMFTAWECKKAGWQYKGTSREKAQLNFLNIVIAHGGEGRFIYE